MNLLEAVNAYMAVNTLMEREMDFDSAYKLAGLKRELEPHAMFYAGEENKLVQKYAKKNERGEPVFTKPGVFAFADGAKSVEFERARGELGAVEISEEIHRICVKRPERITPAAVEALYDLVTFEEA